MGIIQGGNVMPGDGFRTPLTGSGAPTNDVTGLGSVIVGSQYIDTATGKRYTVTATNGTSTVTWVVTGTQV